MGLLDALMGNAQQVDSAEVASEFAPILAQNEQVIAAYRLVRDMLVFTTHRLILVDKQGLTGKKVEYCNLPYRAITHYVVETAGHFDLDAELSIWISGKSEPFTLEIKADNVVGIQQQLAQVMFS